jgi:uncharacterized protein DUF6484
MDWMTPATPNTEVAEPEQPAAAVGVRVATLIVADPAHGLAVAFAEAPHADPVPARSVIVVTGGDIGRTVVVAFDNGNATQPIIVGLLQDRPVRTTPNLTLDGKRVCLEATDELTLRSGKASITLGADGRIVIKGMEIVSRARGTNKIKGAAVQIN